MRLKLNSQRIYLPVLVFIVLIGLWHYIASTGKYPPALLPSPFSVLKGFKELLSSGILFEYILVSLFRLLLGFSIAIGLAVPLGILFVLFPKLWLAFEPFVQVLRPISPIAWFPFIGLWLNSNVSPIFIIFLAALFPILLSTISSFRYIEPIHLKMAANLGLSNWSKTKKIILPSIFPGIVVGLRIALGAAWINLVAGEMMGVRSGLGYLILDSRNMFRTDLVIAGMIIIGLLGLSLDHFIRWIERGVESKWGRNH